MHVFASTLYAVIAFLALLAYCVATSAPLLLVLLVSPLLISGAIIVLMLLDLARVALRWLWRNRATLRLWRSQ